MSKGRSQRRKLERDEELKQAAIAEANDPLRLRNDIVFVDDNYCEIIRTLPMSILVALVFGALLLVSIMLSFFLLTSSTHIYISYNMYVITWGVIVVLAYTSLYFLRVVFTHPEMLSLRLNRHRQRAYIVEPRRSFNIFARWPVEVVVCNWNQIKYHVGWRGNEIFLYRWDIFPVKNHSSASPMRKIVIRSEHYPPASATEISERVMRYIKHWTWCHEYIYLGLRNTPELVVLKQMSSFKHSVAFIINQHFFPVSDDSSWSNIIQRHHPFKFLILLIISPLCLLCSALHYLRMRTATVFKWPDDLDLESRTAP